MSKLIELTVRQRLQGMFIAELLWFVVCGTFLTLIDRTNLVWIGIIFLLVEVVIPLVGIFVLLVQDWRLSR